MNIFITGAESTGKSTLTQQLAQHFEAPFVSEYARDYIAGLGRPYEYSDLEVIAKKQIEQINKARSENLKFFDTGLIITYIWYHKKYNLVPEWLESALPDIGKGKYLLCKPDIPWKSDLVRENPNSRDELSELYQSKIISLGCDVEVVEDQGDARLMNAIKIVEAWLNFKG